MPFIIVIFKFNSLLREKRRRTILNDSDKNRQILSEIAGFINHHKNRLPRDWHSSLFEQEGLHLEILITWTPA